MAYINDNEVLALERARLRLIEETRNKGVDIPNNAQIGEIDGYIKKISAPTSVFDKSIVEFESMANNNVESYSFSNCILLEKVYVPNTTKVSSYAFQNTPKLNNKSGYFPSLTTLDYYSFAYSGFENIVMSSYTGTWPVTASRTPMIRDSEKLKRFIMPYGSTGNYVTDLLVTANLIELIDAKQWIVSTQTVRTSVKTIILRNTSAISNASNNIATALANATIYVPQALLSAYKGATNWSAIADQIVALEGTKYEPVDWYENEDWFLNMYHYTSVLEEEEE